MIKISITMSQYVALAVALILFFTALLILIAAWRKYGNPKLLEVPAKGQSRPLDRRTGERAEPEDPGEPAGGWQDFDTVRIADSGQEIARGTGQAERVRRRSGASGASEPRRGAHRQEDRRGDEQPGTATPRWPTGSGTVPRRRRQDPAGQHPDQRGRTPAQLPDSERSQDGNTTSYADWWGPLAQQEAEGKQREQAPAGR